MKRALIPIVAVSLALLGVASASAEPVPVLGAKAFALPYGAGFGRAEPEVIFNGGDPSGEVSEIHWRTWGEANAIGYGRNSIFKPGGGYYRKPVRIELRATKLGECVTVAAYTRLEVRVPKRPGGKLGGWILWSGAKSICEAPR